MLRFPALLAAACFACACELYDPSLVTRDAGASDAGCVPRHPPQRPDVADAPGDREILFVLRDMELDQGSMWREIGYDLDGLCSYGADPMVECVPRDTSARPETDGVEGIDNVFGHQIIPLLLAGEPLLAESVLDLQEKGLGAVLLHVRGWHGGDDDPRVEVVMSQSVFGTPGLPDGGAPIPEVPDGGVVHDDGGMPPLPRWDGQDYWWAREDSFAMGNVTRPLVRDDNAFVRGRRLVMRLPDRSDVTFSGSEQGVRIQLLGAYVTGRISADATRLEDVVVAGRWTLLDILEQGSTIGVCPGSTEYMLLQNVLARYADIRATAGTGGPGVACDAISVGLRFTGYAARFGGLWPGEPLIDRCTDAGM